MKGSSEWDGWGTLRARRGRRAVVARGGGLDELKGDGSMGNVVSNVVEMEESIDSRVSLSS